MDGKKWKKKTETSLMLLVAVNKFQPKKRLFREAPSQKRDANERRIAGDIKCVWRSGSFIAVAIQWAQPGNIMDLNGLEAFTMLRSF